MRLLLVSHDPALERSIPAPFVSKGHAVDTVPAWSDAETFLGTAAYDLVVLDLGLPEGLDLVRRLRRRAPKVPLLAVSATSDVGERVAALNLGSDDCVARPTPVREIEARAAALIRRGVAGGSATLELGPVTLDTARHHARIGKTGLDLRPREFSLLETLLLNRGRVVSKQGLYDQMFGADSEANVNALEIYVHRLRKKLDTPVVRIRTVRGVGYSLEAAPNRAA